MEAARAVGASGPRVMLRHLLPHATGPIVVHATLMVATAVMAEAALSFLGFGIQPPTASWGNLLPASVSALETTWWLVVFPGLAIFLTVLAVNLVGEGLREALDPRAGRRSR
ncbi:MAG: ABC transporter permease [Acidimicrobiia bacterium]|nr:ABC transporter permease [Acidimicrobiia bacterium]